ncbi:hypothetical protein DPMN_001518 [Dreissena polymorpha]|uniref:Uncharacterized protein n=1 Tax=Dreissena polymorpha TaxID=45954 RepID=A0A9D4MJG7_DREPO|nr:hypothetical protein DPMN_001518 [Dreissena polymorpha]
MNFLTKFHEHRTVNVACRVLTRFHNSHIRKNVPLIQDIIETDLLTKFHENWTINVAARPYIAILEKCPAPGGHVFKATKTIFELIQDIIGTNLLTKFHDDQKITKFYYSHKKMPYPQGGHVFQPTGIIFLNSSKI